MSWIQNLLGRAFVKRQWIWPILFIIAALLALKGLEWLSENTDTSGDGASVQIHRQAVR